MRRFKLQYFRVFKYILEPNEQSLQDIYMSITILHIIGTIQFQI